MFVHLHCHSYYSFLRGTASPAELARRAAELKMPSLALTDTNGIYGAVEFYRACQEAGVKPILGVEISQESERAVFLARDRSGWEEICRLTTARRLDKNFSLRRAVSSAPENIFILTDSPDLVVTAPHPSTSPPAGRASSGQCSPPFDKLRAVLPTLYLELATFMSHSSRKRIMESARDHGVPLVAANDVHFLRPEDWMLAKVLSCIREIRSWEKVSPEAVPSREAWFKDGAEMEAALGGCPAAFSAAARIAEECECELELGRVHLPRCPLPPGVTSQERLRALCRVGLSKRYGRPFPELERRLEKELDVIFRRGFADYFLLIEEIVDFARRHGVPTLGRGSAVGSLVCYLLGITHVDPLKYNLYFERFLNPERSDPPDIDLDFPHHRRDEVIDHIYRRFGEEKVAMISTTVRFRARAALRETAKVGGWSEEEANRLTRHLPYYSSLRDPERIRREVPECRHLPWDNERFRSLLSLASRLEGFPRHLSVHPGGMVIAPEPLTRYLALEKAAKGIVVTQPDMHAVKDLGLVKMDILGQRALAVVEDALRELSERGRRIDFAAFDPSRDEKTRDLVGEGRTIGCFYIESPIMRRLLKRLSCRDFETLIAASSIIRPGVSNTGLSERYIARHLGQEAVVRLHPLVDGILEETHGVMVYQEQVMQVVNEAAGMSLAESDRFRRCMSKKPGWEDLGNYRERFLSGAAGRGIPGEIREELWRQIEGFAAYAFCKAHSASFALLSFQCAYLKANFPAGFMAALINHRGGFYPTREYVEEARRMGLGILPPDVNKSAFGYRAEGEEIRIGLAEIRGLRLAAIRNILREREKRIFSSWGDFAGRAGASAPELSALVRSGALDCLGESRIALRWKLAAGIRGAPEGGLFPNYAEESGPRLPELAEQPDERERGEESALGFPLSRREDDCRRRLKALAPAIPLIRAADQLRRAGQEVQFIGWPVTERLTRTTTDGRLMKFLTLEDSSGLFEVVLFPDCYARCGHHLAGPGPFYVRGRVQVKDSVPAVICNFLSSLRFRG